MAQQVQLAYSLFYLSIALILFSLPFEAFFFISLGTILLPLSLIILHYQKQINSSFFPTQIKFILFLLLLSTLLLCFTAFSSKDINEALDKVQRKLPFFLIPLPFWFTPKQINLKWLRIILHSFLLLILFIASFSLINALLFHYQETLSLVSNSKSIPLLTPISHIYFSTIQGFSIFLAFYLAKTRHVDPYPFPLMYYSTLIILLILTLFLTLSRTGLVSFLLTATIYLFFFKKFKNHDFIKKVLILILFILFSFLAFLFYQPLQIKIQNMVRDLSYYSKSHPCITDYSLSQRLASLEIAWDLIQHSPWFGYSIGDVKSVFEIAASQSRFQTADIVLPHNQFILTWLQGGIFPLLLLLAFFFLGFLFHRKSPLPALFYIYFFFVFQAEYFLERQVGISFFLIALFFSHFLSLSHHK